MELNTNSSAIRKGRNVVHYWPERSGRRGYPSERGNGYGQDFQRIITINRLKIKIIIVNYGGERPSHFSARYGERPAAEVAIVSRAGIRPPALTAQREASAGADEIKKGRPAAADRPGQSDFSSLEEHLERELNVTLAADRGSGDLAEVAVAAECLRIAQVGVRNTQHREVAEVEGFRAEL